MYKMNNADIKEWAKNYEGEPFDAILCDPPYELGFMGKSWDSSGIAFDQDMWADLFRHIKPGGHLLAFSGSRTYHRMAVAIEDAGFEIRDMIEWIYGSGFPKSLDISKAIDKNNGKNQVDLTPFGSYIKERRESKGYSRKQLDELMGTNTAVSWWEGRASGVQLPSKATYEKLKPILELDNRFDELIDWAEAEREVIGKKMSGIANKDEGQRYTIGASKSVEVDITLPSTNNAKIWNGYGTALKPAHEPCVLARKPIEGTVANNVLKHGTGGLNIDGTRVGTETRINNANGATAGGARIQQLKPGVGGGEVTGRFPANLIHDGSDEVEAVFPQTKPSKSGGKGKPIPRADNLAEETVTQRGGFDDNGGSASRFFYTAKSSKSERNMGLDSTVSIRVQLEICENNITRQENLAQLQVVMDNSHLKATAESGIGTKSGTEWSMSWFGNRYTEKYPINIKSTTKTTTSSTTTSVILNWLTGLLTNESTLGVNLEMASGGNPVKSAESSSALIATINDQTASALGVNNAQASKRLLISVSDGKNFHSTVKPLSLTKYLATLIKPPTGGRLLVPFSGSGSEMIGALQAGWEYVEGVELTEEYIPIAEARIKYWLSIKEEESNQLELINV